MHTHPSRGLIAVILCLTACVASAHPGGLDAKGCHRNTKTGTRHCHPGPSAYSLSNPPHAGDEGAFYGPLVRITDGDSLFAKVQGVVMEFRLAEIDAPEFDQPYGAAAKRELITLIAGKPLVMVPFDTDSYGRTVARVWVGDMQLNRELVKRGAAWFLSKYAQDDALFHVEEEARAARRGLWALPAHERVEPWEWRARKRAAHAKRSSGAAAPKAAKPVREAQREDGPEDDELE